MAAALHPPKSTSSALRADAAELVELDGFVTVVVDVGGASANPGMSAGTSTTDWARAVTRESIVVVVEDSSGAGGELRGGAG